MVWVVQLYTQAAFQRVFILACLERTLKTTESKDFNSRLIPDSAWFPCFYFAACFISCAAVAGRMLHNSQLSGLNTAHKHKDPTQKIRSCHSAGYDVMSWKSLERCHQKNFGRSLRGPGVEVLNMTLSSTT